MGDNLEELQGVGQTTADKLEDAGYDSYRSIAVASPGDLNEDAGVGTTKAKKLIRAAKEKTDVGDFETGYEVYERRKDMERISFLYDDIDELFGDLDDEGTSGIQTQAITEFYGEYGSGKSQITHQLCVNVQLPREVGGLHGRPIFIDTEESFRPGRMKDMVEGLPEEVLEVAMEEDDVEDVEELVKVYLNRVLKVDAENSDHQMLLGEEADKKASELEDSEYPVKLLVVDSIMGNFRQEYSGRGNLAERQQKLNKHLNDLAGFAKLRNAAVVLANQVAANPNSAWGGSQAVGGHVLGHNSTYRVQIKQAKGKKRKLRMKDAPDLSEGDILIKIDTEGIIPG
jgi:DNA repair protein RadA